jgi:ribosomal protein L35AE/L33A
VSAGLFGITVLRTMVERRVQPLKQRVTLLYDYSRVEDPTRKTMEMLEVFEVMKQVEGLVSSGTVVAVEGAVGAFSVNFRPNLVGRLDLFFFLC